MSINLNHILRRNKSNLEIFISKNKLTSYLHLVEYCQTRKFIPCTEEEYNVVAKKEVVPDEREKASRSASKTQEPKKRRYRRKKQQGTSKLSNSTNKR